MRWGLCVGIAMLGLAACSQPEPPAPPPPPPPPPPAPAPTLEPPDPYYFAMELPPKTAAGGYETPNSDIGPLEQLFHFRSALNVAALSCRHLPGYDLAPQYNEFIKTFAEPLRNANSAIEAKFRREHGGDGPRVRDTHMTSLYNHFARPGTLGTFCPMARRNLTEALALSADGLDAYALASLAQMEAIFQEHFAEVEAYQENYRQRMQEFGLTEPPETTVTGRVGTSS
ncbi:hypothetical protein B5C34_14750 [Pacificimonas flava]|uniref:Uncharacterized protein n=2 Tax=Pacificimonas TaxID=1960290 RepID=A0A219B1Q9_9SPHN|nr:MULTISPECIES: hypothetical protein [Pacificimonas]MBZ6379778.1 hypothetical protein [Pacificimonas aurantium]OWV31768.1 hypothetical protein B5C34_14750 [Pacificimonas flava]